MGTVPSRYEKPRRKPVASTSSIRRPLTRAFSLQACKSFPSLKSLEEVDRDDQLHYFNRVKFHGNYKSPLVTPSHILDLGTGSGLFVLELADKFTKCSLVGLDILCNFPQLIHPPNCTFRQSDLVYGLPFRRDYFDFVHQRGLGKCISKKNWPGVLNEIFRVLDLDGYVELHEIDLFLYDAGENGSIVNDWLSRLCRRCDLDGRFSDWLIGALREAGFADIQHESRRYYIGGPMDRNRLYFQLLFANDGIGVMDKKEANQCGIDDEEYERVRLGLMQELSSTNCYQIATKFWARKP